MNKKLSWIYKRFSLLLPVIIILMLFAGAIWVFIGRGANDYLAYVAERSIEQQLRKLEKEVQFTRGDNEKLNNTLKMHFSAENEQTQLLMLNDEYEEIYHSSRRNYGDQIAAELIDDFLKGQIDETPAAISIDGDDYEAAVYTIDELLSTPEGHLSTELSTNQRALTDEEKGKEGGQPNEATGVDNRSKDSQGSRQAIHSDIKENDNESTSVSDEIDAEGSTNNTGQNNNRSQEKPRNQECSGKYYIIYQKIGNATVLLREMRTYIIYITVPMLIIASCFIFFISHILEKRELALERQREHDMMRLEAEHEKERLALEAERERAEDAARAQAEREKLFRDISHDLRTPLVSIIGYADGIKRGVMKDTEGAAAVIVREGNRMQRLLESGLTLSKLDSNAWKINKMLISVDELIEEQVEVLKKLDDKKKITFITKEDSKEIMLSTDPDLLIRIIQNIVSDCMRYAESEVEIKLSAQEYVTITISDDGPGVL
ncbi:MAG: HAMP domain-containing histidine kinase, partial [Butyrivibrio sp.]|nr:HAMP domain-containing histidine kinase [Butyrivibrio sp.]